MAKVLPLKVSVTDHPAVKELIQAAQVFVLCFEATGIPTNGHALSKHAAGAWVDLVQALEPFRPSDKDEDN